MGALTAITYYEVTKDLADPWLFHIFGFVVDTTTNTPLVSVPVHLIVNSNDVGTYYTFGQQPAPFDIDYRFNIIGNYFIQVKFLGDATYDSCESAIIEVIAGIRTPTTLSAGATPTDSKIFDISGILLNQDTQIGIDDQTVHLFVDGIETASVLTHPSVQGNVSGTFTFVHTFTVVGDHTFQVRFFGTDGLTASNSTIMAVTISCTLDTDCSAGYICQGGNCILNQSCVVDADCPIGYLCQGGQCIASDGGIDWTQIAIIGGLLGALALAVYAAS